VCLPRSDAPAPRPREGPRHPASCWSATSSCSTGVVGLGHRRSGRPEHVSGYPLLRSSLPSELLLNRRYHEVHEDDVVHHAVHPEATVQLPRDTGRQLRPRCVGLRHQTSRLLVLRSRRTARTTPTPVLRALREPPRARDVRFDLTPLDVRGRPRRRWPNRSQRDRYPSRSSSPC